MLGQIVHLLADWINDDYLGSQMWTLTLANDTKAYFDAIIHGTSAPPGNMRFSGQGALYDVTLVWKVYN